MSRAAVDDDEGQGDEAVGRARGQAEEQGFEEPVHQYPRYALRMLSSAAIVSASPEATIVAGLQEVHPLGDVHRQVGVLLDQQHGDALLACSASR